MPTVTLTNLINHEIENDAGVLERMVYHLAADLTALTHTRHNTTAIDWATLTITAHRNTPHDGNPGHLLLTATVHTTTTPREAQPHTPAITQAHNAT